MHRITVNTGVPYEVLIERGMLSRLGDRTAEVLSPGRTAAILSDSNVWPLYGETAVRSLKQAGFSVCHYVFPAGESSKTPETLISFVEFLAENGLTRSDLVIALGGGVTGDMGGLAASLYQRGIDCVQVPTSLLAMVDSSVGGKTAVDLPQGKNLMGTFTQPRLVICDPDVLRTLKPEVYNEGMAEVIKYGMFGNRDLLTRLAAEETDIADIIAVCVDMKRAVVDEDEKETGMRQILNFGHTIGHAVERLRHFSIYHGEGVAIGMAVMTRGCVRLGRCPRECDEILEPLLAKYHLPNRTDLPSDDLIRACRADKKRRGNRITLIEPDAPGSCVLVPSDFEDLRKIIEAGREEL